MKRSLLLYGAVAILLSSCSLTLPVTGKIQSTAEVFTGTATGYMDGSGDLIVTMASGTTCKGHFVYVSERQGEGIFNCDDSRSGPFKFVSSGQRGVGDGHLAGDAFTFTFGEFDSSQN